MFGGRKTQGKKLIETEDVTMICEVDEFGNPIPGTCEPVVGVEQGHSKTFKYPTPGPVKMMK